MESKKPTKFDTGKKVVAKKALVGTATINDIFTKRFIPLDWTYNERGKSISVYNKADMSSKCMLRIHYVGIAKIDGFTLTFVSPDCKDWWMAVPKTPLEETMLRTFIAKLRKKDEEEAIKANNEATSLELNIDPTPSNRKKDKEYAVQTWMVCEVMMTYLCRAITYNWRISMFHECLKWVSTIIEAFRRFDINESMTKDTLAGFIKDLFNPNSIAPLIGIANHTMITDSVAHIDSYLNIDLAGYINRNIENIVIDILKKTMEENW